MNISLDSAQALLEALKRNPADAALLLGGKPYMELLWALGGIVYPAQAQLRNTPHTGTATTRPSHSPTPGGNTMSQSNTETALEFLSDAQDSMNDQLETLRALLETGKAPDMAAVTETLRQLEEDTARVTHPTEGLAFFLNVTPELAA